MSKDDKKLIKFSDVLNFFERLIARFSVVASIGIYSLLAVYNWFPDFLNQALKFSIFETIALSILLAIFGRILQIEEKFSKEIDRKRTFQIHSKREDAYSYVCNLLSGRRAKQIDLLQFSGATAITVIQQISKSSPNATIRLLLIEPERAKTYDMDRPDHHLDRIKGTLAQLNVIKNDYPNLTVGVWFYTTEPGISGIVVDNWMVSVGWYHVFPIGGLPNNVSILGHATPAITAIDKDAEPLLLMVQAQFEAVLKNARLGRAFGPKVESFKTYQPALLEEHKILKSETKTSEHQQQAVR
jgi:hypothetical protein